MDGRHPNETLARSELAKLQEQRLLGVLPTILARSALVGGLWRGAKVSASDIRSLADFKAKAPFMDKDAVRDFRERTSDPYGGLLCVDPSTLAFVASSSGTTGDPTPFASRLTRGAGGWPADFWEPAPGEMFGCNVRDLYEYGLRPGDYVTLFVPTMRGASFRLFQEAGGVPILFDHHPDELPRFVELARRYRPKLMYLLSTPLILGLEALERQTGIDLVDVFSSFEAVVFGGEPLSERAKGLLERWRMPVFQHASLGDAGTIWECRARDGMHAWEDHVLVEVLDPETLEEVPDGGRGELVVTALTNLTAPLVRFRSGDLVKVDRRACACGRTHLRVWLLGRAGDEIVVDGKVILPRDVWTAIEFIDETSSGLFQIIRPERVLSALKLRVGYAGTVDETALREKVAQAVEALVGVVPEVRLVPNEELLKLGPPHKIPRTAKA